VSIEVTDRLRTARVPSMRLQPLVENAIRHGNASRTGHAAIRVRARADGASLVLDVEDDGPGTTGTAATGGLGVGLTATAERLRLLYGDAQRFETGDSPDGGYLARVWIPLTPQ
jgi:LytS/YehU family sensor histidine kinase